MRFFFFGTLMDADIRGIVLGRPLPDRQCLAAGIGGYRRVFAAGKDFPLLVTESGGRVCGVLVGGLSRVEAARLRHFEGDDYQLARRPVDLPDGSRCTAHLFLALARLHPTDEDWDFAAWRRRHKRRFQARARAIMAGYGRERLSA
ncbi:MAG TPA: gamma-glutamylcyclotransferase family protein [Candidatus Sulfotelmatobacter sp.]|nr:gamma-glutamylcyclotransferase family protein [Candidatus Sulfotelmatobacter sp.]